jgi:HTH-type transcriptional regulator / antitoxin HigA
VTIEIRPIRTEQDYEAAVAEIGRLWGAPVGSEEGDKLDILVMLVDRYEDRRWPIEDDMDAIELLHFAIDELGHTQAELASFSAPARARPKFSAASERSRSI